VENRLSGETKKILQKHGLRPKKKFGQNFLINEEIMERILEAAELVPDDLVVEIGPGLGGLTQQLAQRAGGLLAIEIDEQLVSVLEQVLAVYPNVKLIRGDILKLDLDREVKQFFPNVKFPYKIVANLPYYITTPIVMGLLEQKKQISSMVLMVQKEVGERMQASPGTKAYGSLSIAVQYYADIKLIQRVPPSSFRPAPEVDSVVIKLEMRATPKVEPRDEQLFFQVVRGAFAQRRKTLVNSLSNTFPKIHKGELVSILGRLNIDPNVRGEQLSLEQFCAIANAVGES